MNAHAENSYLFYPEAVEEPPSPLVGIARLAAEGESVRTGHNVEYFTLEARSILNRCTAPRMPFTWTINPYRGCEFACKYCYARYTHEFMEIRDSVEFERQIYIKQGAAPTAAGDSRPGANLRWLLRRAPSPMRCASGSVESARKSWHLWPWPPRRTRYC